MRILFALHGYLPTGRGGTEVHVHALARRLQKDHVVRVVCREGNPKKPEYAVTRDVYEGVEVVRINNLQGWAPDLESTYKNGRVHELFERELVDFRPDLVHVHHLTGLSSTIVETIKAGGLPLVMTLHDFWTVCPRGQRIKKEFEICEDVDRNLCFHCLAGIWPHLFGDRSAHRTELDPRGRLAPRPLAEFDRHFTYLLNLADVLIAPSWFHRERMLDFPIDPDRIVALPHGLDPSPFAAIERTARPFRRIGYIGSVIPIKGAHVLVDAFRHLARGDLELHIHGEAFPFHDDRNYGERLKSRALGLRNVRFHGPYLPQDLPRILADLDVLVTPSLWWETFCLTIREGQLAGVPVIASDLGAMREALDGESCGLLFHPGDARDLADRIEQLAGDPELRARLSRCQGAVKTLDAYVPELLGLYERARAVSAKRSGTIVVAPPSFPEPPPEVRVSWTLDKGAPVTIAGEAGAEREFQATISDRATGAKVGTIGIAVDVRGPVALRRANVGDPKAAASPVKKAVPERSRRTPDSTTADTSGAPAVPAASAAASGRPVRRQRRQRRERRKRSQ
jgi:glycosyltransferase involved in cell wall biosynthesis